MSDQKTHRQDARRREILATCLKCFASKGFHQTSMRDLCAALEMSAGALYRYFDSKQTIITALIEEDRIKMEAIFSSIPAEMPFSEVVDHLLTQNQECFADSSELILFNQINSEGTVNPSVGEALTLHYASITDCLESLVRRAQKRKEIDTMIRPRDAAVFIISAFDGIYARAAFDPLVDWRKMTSSFRDLILRALGSVKPKGKGGKP